LSTTRSWLAESGLGMNAGLLAIPVAIAYDCMDAMPNSSVIMLMIFENGIEI
jgi:hypothetical protein